MNLLRSILYTLTVSIGDVCSPRYRIRLNTKPRGGGGGGGGWRVRCCTRSSCVRPHTLTTLFTRVRWRAGPQPDRSPLLECHWAPPFLSSVCLLFSNGVCSVLSFTVSVTCEVNDSERLLKVHGQTQQDDGRWL